MIIGPAMGSNGRLVSHLSHYTDYQSHILVVFLFGQYNQDHRENKRWNKYPTGYSKGMMSLRGENLILITD